MTDEQTKPAPPADKLEYAIYLAKAGRKTEARQVLRRAVALQPANGAAWLWLSGVTDDRAEAETALAQARKINPNHPSLRRAEQWLAERFSGQPPTRATAVTTIPLAPAPATTTIAPEEPPVVSAPPTTTIAPEEPLPAPAPPPEDNRAAPTSPGWAHYTPGQLLGCYLAPDSPNLPRLINLVSLGLVLLAVGVALVVLLVGLAVAAGAREPAAPVTPAPAPTETSDPAALERFAREHPPELDAAWQQRDWTRAIAILQDLYRANPASQPVKEQLSHAYLQQGVALRHKGYVEEALAYFERALAVTPDQERAGQEFRLATDYLRGSQYYQAGQWPGAIEALEDVWQEDEGYVHVQDLLYSAYYNHGLAEQAAGRLPEARTALTTAVALRPDLAEPRLQLAEVEFALTPGTALATPLPSAGAMNKLIVVGILEQRMLVFEGERQVYDFVVSTGEPGRDTAIGDFEILDKIDVAYASTWNLDMPYWMGIYWSGPLENGIHALPIVRHTGYKLWDGYLGQRVSYGCVILGDEDAATLYNWTEVGVPMKIVWSLDDWLSQRQGE